MRIDKVLETASGLMERQIELAYAELQSYYDKNSKVVDDMMAKLCNELISKGISAQQAGKGAIEYLSISQLSSSLLTESGDFHIALYDKQFYFDEEPVYVYWSPAFIWEQYFRDMEKIIGGMKKEMVRLKKYELDAVRVEYAERFFKIAHKLFADYAYMFVSGIEQSQLEVSADFMITYGGFFDVAVPIWEKGEI